MRKIPAATALALGFALACSAQASGSEHKRTVRDRTITVFLADPELGVVGMYREGNSAIFFETVSQPLSTSANRAGSQIVARFVDLQGNTIGGRESAGRGSRRNHLRAGTADDRAVVRQPASCKIARRDEEQPGVVRSRARPGDARHPARAGADDRSFHGESAEQGDQ